MKFKMIIPNVEIDNLVESVFESPREIEVKDFKIGKENGEKVIIVDCEVA